jgi:formylglycine-generating enzyme required for sulfatase activity
MDVAGFRFAFVIASCGVLLLQCGCSPSEQSPKSNEFEGSNAGTFRDDNLLKLTFVWCPPGDFEMGTPDRMVGHLENENQVRVTLSRGFWMSQTEITQKHWEAVARTTPWKDDQSVEEGPEYPATHVGWQDCMEFCRKLTEQEQKAGRLPIGWEYTLPTEAQWEYACRAGTTTIYTFGNGSDHEKGRFIDYVWGGRLGDLESDPHTHPVGLKKANAWGFHDVHGNVWEWCRDFYGDRQSGGRDPSGPAIGTTRVIRGGSWNTVEFDCRSAHRVEADPALRNNETGFRIAANRSPQK